MKRLRQERGWSQDELARRAGIARASVSAIEIERLVPSVAAALALAAALEVTVEQLFGQAGAESGEAVWAWPPQAEPCRFWQARVGGKILRFPVEPTAAGVIGHDGIFQNGAATLGADPAPGNSLVMAGCDPAAGLLVSAFAKVSGLRLLVLQRSSRQALDLLRRGLVDVAGVHLSAARNDMGNVAAARSVLGPGYSLLKLANWQDGLAVGSGVGASSVGALLRSRARWIGREPGSGARQCQDELLHDRLQPRRTASDHRGVAEAVRCGWADVGVCVRLSCEDAGLRFLPIREEAYDLCFASVQEGDPRLRALVQTVRSASYRRLLSELPGYDCSSAGEMARIE